MRCLRKAASIGCAHIFVTVYLLGAGTGIQLRYFLVAAMLPLVVHYYQTRVLAGLGTVVAALYLIAHFVFAGGVAPRPLPEPVLQIMYVTSVVCAVGSSMVCAYLFKSSM